jgi:hypothetical protein
MLRRPDCHGRPPHEQLSRSLWPPRAVRSELLRELGRRSCNPGIDGSTERMREASELYADPRRRAELRMALGRALLARIIG